MFRATDIEPYAFWLLSAIVLYLVYLIAQSQWSVILFLIPYMTLVPAISIRFIHKRNILAILGLNKKVFLSFMLLLSTFSAAVYFFLPPHLLEIIPNVIVTPASEEFFFRAYMFRAFINPNLETAWNERRTWIIIVLSSLLFSVGHLIYPYLLLGKQLVFITIVGQVLTRMVFGALFCWLFLSTKNILMPVILHIFVNSISYL